MSLALSEDGALRRLHEARARAELAAIGAAYPGSDVVAWRGTLVPAVAVVKGLAGPAEAAGGAALSGADGEAAAKALEALGHDSGQVFYTLSRPEATMTPAERGRRLREQLEAVDAPLVVALDREAAEDLRAAFGLEALPEGAAVRASGRRLVACAGLEASLGDERAKREVWRQLSAATPEAPAF